MGSAKRDREKYCTQHANTGVLFMSLVFTVRVNKLARVKLKVTKADIVLFFIFNMYKTFNCNV